MTDVVRIAARWGFTSLLLILALVEWTGATIGLWIGVLPRDPRPRILRHLLERAGGTWVKLGQMLAMRSDFLPPHVVGELWELLDNVPPFPFKVAKDTIEADFGRPLDQVFVAFPESVLAAASFGQVYRARLHCGHEVAVKVMRPGLGPTVRADLLQLRLLGLLVDTLELSRPIRFKSQVDQLERIMHEEIDYRHEADNIRRVAKHSHYIPIMKIPAVYDEFSTAHVLTMEFLDGVWIKDLLKAVREGDVARLDEFRARGLNRRLVARRIFEISLRHVFDIGPYHADPHAANIVVLKDNVIGYVDFGNVGHMDDELADTQRRYLEAIQDGRIADAARALTETVIVPERRRIRLPEFRAQLGNQIREWRIRVGDPNASLRAKSIAQLILDNLGLMERFGFGAMENTIQYYRALITSDVVVFEVDPQFDPVSTLRRYFHNREIRCMRESFDRKSLIRTNAAYVELWQNVPRIVRQFSHFLRHEEDGFGVVVAEFAGIYRTIANASLLAFVVVVVAGLLRVPDIGVFIGFPFSLDWRWFAPFLLVCWRIASLVRRG